MSKWDVSNFDNWTPQDIPEGFLALEAGNSVDYITGGWRSIRPIWEQPNCTNCMMCWVACPDSSILVKDGEMVGIDYDHCKGCGLCAVECHFQALDMMNETEALEAGL
ncbi:MAG: 4Fe-4S binding protein [Eggerthellaceae bacterium]|nr:4Fe-4S binding protein [Eggerthellaceae bacterium]